MQFHQINREYTGPNHTMYQANDETFIYTITKNGAKPAKGEYKWLVRIHPVKFVAGIPVPEREHPIYTQGWDTKTECVKYARAFGASTEYSVDKRNRDGIDAAFGLTK